MFLVKKYLQSIAMGCILAIVLLVGVLVVNFDLFAHCSEFHNNPHDDDPPNCSEQTQDCCDAIEGAFDVCEDHGSYSISCEMEQWWAGTVCGYAAEACGYGVYHLCAGN